MGSFPLLGAALPVSVLMGSLPLLGAALPVSVLMGSLPLLGAALPVSVLVPPRAFRSRARQTSPCPPYIMHPSVSESHSKRGPSQGLCLT
jgi:hypothetical protein